MHKKYLIIGSVFIISGYFLNELFLWIIRVDQQTHYGPPVVGTIFLLFIPFGIILVVLSFVSKDNGPPELATHWDGLD
ncbi:MAG: hypothetical protein ACXAEB_15970 [Candidatus Thorarchaeota archaeon]